MDDLLAGIGESWEPWSSLAVPVPYRLFGRGSRRPFSAYLDSPTRVPASSIAEVEDWLLGCTSVDDRTLFGEEDYWSLPGEFELLRMGDCDDHALWAWRKFVDLGLRTSLVSGRWLVDGQEELHVFVLVRSGEEEYIFEATSKTRGEAMIPMSRARARYRPHFAVNQRLETRVYLGSVSELLPIPRSWDFPTR